MTYQCVTFGNVCDIIYSMHRFTEFMCSNTNSDLWDSYKHGHLLGEGGIAESPINASVPDGFEDGLSRI